MKGRAVNELGQPVGEAVEKWRPALRPRRDEIPGVYCKLVPLDPSTHSSQLHEAFRQDQTGGNWTYLPYGPFPEADQFHAWVSEQSEKSDPLFFAVVRAASDRALGVVSFMRISEAIGSIEIGHIHFSPQLQGTVAATEAIYLMLETVFSAGFRRCEWKCNALNQESRSAAQRLGFTFEGVFRQAAIIKGRNRDTAWFSMLDKEWPVLAPAYESWLQPQNFDSEGAQKRRLSKLTASALAQQA